MKTLLSLLTLLSLFSSCSKSSSKHKMSSPLRSTPESSTGTIIPDAQREHKTVITYLAPLSTLNQHVVAMVTGALTLYKEDDLFIGDIRVNGASPNILHSQSIHVGRCPNQSYDINADGFVDAAEAAIPLGPQILPLDGDLNAQLAEYGTYPVSDQYGNYTYSEVASYQKLLKDLQSPDERASDDVTKLRIDEELDFVDKVVVIRGVSDDTALPVTVASIGGLSKFQTFPIACGTLKTVRSTPGTYEDDPTSDVVMTGSSGGETVGGSGGADDGAIRPGQVSGGGGEAETGGDYGEDEESTLL